VAADDKFKRVPFSTVDGVELEGTYYPGKKDVTVLLLHNFDMKSGGSSHADGWDHLAEKLQEAGFAVFSFDFRGFGNSKTVNRDKFWAAPHNKMYLRPGTKSPENIDQKNFPAGYYYYLINDIEAAKAYLDRKNDSNELNTSNLVIIGAGEGAALGALWLHAQCRLQRDRAWQFGPLPPPPALDEPECRDVAAAIWLSMKPSLLNNGRLGVRSALIEAARDQKIPMAFLYGKRDNGGASFSRRMTQDITTQGGKKLDLKFTGEKDFDTELAGSKLLQDSLTTEDFIIEKYLKDVLEARGSRERKKRETDRFGYYWSRTKVDPRTTNHVVAKRPGEEMIPVIPAPEFFGSP
jgi:pimeloyl-ACP methyl ester carboxylesterase